jgi:hypothetical protein
MATVTYTRDAKCRDCDFFRYYYKGKRKLHKCIIKRESRTLKDKLCSENKFIMREGYYPKRLHEGIFA